MFHQAMSYTASNLCRVCLSKRTTSVDRAWCSAGMPQQCHNSSDTPQATMSSSGFVQIATKCLAAESVYNCSEVPAPREDVASDSDAQAQTRFVEPQMRHAVVAAADVAAAALAADGMLAQVRACPSCLWCVTCLASTCRG